ncbi:Chromosome partition protein Smc [Carpediemonas membranifera]|uniref:Chromosome partition protein Smc n=1 Tax=Carpediemonas membranifera TaxID=201153 RepID=A0A8J6BAM2_9EUKA|nr:Chromosome partition protein Smc [Carpediemonas membranifera]|eukprot:KAG9396749.1 Chromosome partition protein Smc [Carpediemonas membranifera]
MMKSRPLEPILERSMLTNIQIPEEYTLHGTVELEEDTSPTSERKRMITPPDHWNRNSFRRQSIIPRPDHKKRTGPVTKTQEVQTDKTEQMQLKEDLDAAHSRIAELESTVRVSQFLDRVDVDQELAKARTEERDRAKKDLEWQVGQRDKQLILSRVAARVEQQAIKDQADFLSEQRTNAAAKELVKATEARYEAMVSELRAANSLYLDKISAATEVMAYLRSVCDTQRSRISELEATVETMHRRVRETDTQLLAANEVLHHSSRGARPDVGPKTDGKGLEAKATRAEKEAAINGEIMRLVSVHSSEMRAKDGEIAKLKAALKAKEGVITGLRRQSTSVGGEG